MVNLKKAAKLIKNDGLFTFIYNEMKELKKKEELLEEEILELLKKHPRFLDDYKELNTQSEISNIQLKKQEIFESDLENCKEIKRKINENIDKLIALEAFEKPGDSMIYTVWIGSLTIFLIFVIHNLIVLYTFRYENYKEFVFASYITIIVGGYFYYIKKINLHNIRHKKFKKLENETKYLINKGLVFNCFKEEELYS